MKSHLKSWHIMALVSGKDGNRELLLCAGITRKDCEKHLPDSISRYSYQELKKFDSIWIEEWTYDEAADRFHWLPRRFLDLRRWKLRAAALAEHAARRRRNK